MNSVKKFIEAVAYLDIGAGGYLDLGSDLPDERLLSLPKGRHALGIIGTYGIDGYVAAPVTAADMADQGARKFEAGYAAAKAEQSAAAHELLEALRSAMEWNWLDDDARPSRVAEICDAAIAKATKGSALNT